VQSTSVVHWDKHALRLNAQQLCKYTQHAWNYFTQTIAPKFWWCSRWTSPDQIAHMWG